MNEEPGAERLLTGWLRLVEERWVSTGTPRRDRAELRGQLLRDLAVARAAGARIEELTSTDPTEFADATVAGLRSGWRPISTKGLLLTCLGTGSAAAGAGWLLLVALSHLDVGPWGTADDELYLVVDLFVVASVLAAMVLTARWTYRTYADAVALTPRLALALVVGTLVGFPLASSYGARHAYRLDASVVAVEILIVAAFLGLGVVAAQRWTTRLRRPASR